MSYFLIRLFKISFIFLFVFSRSYCEYGCIWLWSKSFIRFFAAAPVSNGIYIMCYLPLLLTVLQHDLFCVIYSFAFARWTVYCNQNTYTPVLQLGLVSLWGLNHHITRMNFYLFRLRFIPAFSHLTYLLTTHFL